MVWSPRARILRRSIRAQAVVLFVALALLPAGLVAGWLTRLYAASVLTAERQLQTAALDELAAATTAELDAAVDDLRAVAEALALAVAQDQGDASFVAVRSVLATRERVAAVRFQVPSARVSTVLRRVGDRTPIPEATAEQRRRADAERAVVEVQGDGVLLIVVPVARAPGGARGYAVTVVQPWRLQEHAAGVAGTRFDDPDVELLVVSSERRVVVAEGASRLVAGADATSLPLVALLASTSWDRGLALVADHEVGGVPRVAAVQTVPAWRWMVGVSRPRAVAYRNLTALTPRFILAAAAVLAFALGTGVLAAQAVTRPVMRLAQYARSIGRRERSAVELDTARGDELGDLSRAMVAMARDLETSEAAVVREAELRVNLSRFMSQQVVDAIVAGEHALALGGKRAEVTVLFADVVAFTPLAETHPAEQVVSLLNELFGVLSEVVFRHEGVVDKFLGDSIMAVWGAPIATADHAVRALAAARDMQRFLEAANDEWRERFGFEIRLAIGVNSGEAIVGNIGSVKRMEYTVVGDTVNVAARLEALARPGQILIGARTRELVRDQFALRDLGPHTLTGRAATVAVFEVV